MIYSCFREFRAFRGNGFGFGLRLDWRRSPPCRKIPSSTPWSSAVVRPGPPSRGCWRPGIIRRCCSTARRPDRAGWPNRCRPSTRKLMAEVGVLDAVERAGFYRSTGNTVWWASDDPRVETFGLPGHADGYQVHRPDFDRVLRDSARDAGASLSTDARVHDVRFDGDQSARVEYDAGGARRVASCRFVLDCLGPRGRCRPAVQTSRTGPRHARDRRRLAHVGRLGPRRRDAHRRREPR